MFELLLVMTFQINPAVQTQRELVRSIQMREMMENPKKSAVLKQMEEAREAAVRDYFFAQKFNKLVDKLKQFTEDYNSGKVDAKTVAELKKAWRSLEKDEGWLHEPKEKRRGDEKKSPDTANTHTCGSS